MAIGRDAGRMALGTGLNGLEGRTDGTDPTTAEAQEPATGPTNVYPRKVSPADVHAVAVSQLVLAWQPLVSSPLDPRSMAGLQAHLFQVS